MNSSLTKIIGGDGVSRTHSARGRRIYSPLGLPIFLHLQKFIRLTTSYVSPSLLIPFTQVNKAGWDSVRHLGYLTNVSIFVQRFCASRCFTLPFAGQLLSNVSFSCWQWSVMRINFIPIVSVAMLWITITLLSFAFIAQTLYEDICRC